MEKLLIEKKSKGPFFYFAPQALSLEVLPGSPIEFFLILQGKQPDYFPNNLRNTTKKFQEIKNFMTQNIKLVSQGLTVTSSKAGKNIAVSSRFLRFFFISR